MSLDNDQYKELFIEEAKEHIECLTKSMLTLEKEPHNKEIVNMLFRSAHTLKGSSGMMGFKDFQELTHKMEDVFDGMRKGNAPTPELITTLLECVDALSARLERIQKGIEGEIEVEALKKRLLGSVAKATSENVTRDSANSTRIYENASVELGENEKEALQRAKNSGEKAYCINLKFSDDCSFKGIRANMILSKISKVGEIVKTVPDRKELDEEKLERGFKLVVATKSDERELEKCAQEVLEVENVEVAPIESFGEGKEQKSTPTLGEEKTFCVGIENGKVT
ncbi:MAG: Hpt domain-containing protein, partial [Candidatus Bathyarchaeia archaeon]